MVFSVRLGSRLVSTCFVFFTEHSRHGCSCMPLRRDYLVCCRDLWFLCTLCIFMELQFVVLNRIEWLWHANGITNSCTLNGTHYCCWCGKNEWRFFSTFKLDLNGLASAIEFGCLRSDDTAKSIFFYSDESEFSIKRIDSMLVKIGERNVMDMPANCVQSQCVHCGHERSWCQRFRRRFCQFMLIDSIFLPRFVSMEERSQNR